MSRRTSRTLIALLALTLICAIVAYTHQPGKASAKLTDPHAKSVTPLMVIGGAAPATRPADTTPAVAPIRVADSSVTRTATPTSGPSDARPPARPGDGSWESLLGNGGTPAGPPPAAVKPAPGSATVASASFAPGTVSQNPLADGKARLDAGEMLAGRKILNDALNAGTLSPADAASAMALIANANKIIIFDVHHYSDDPYGGNYLVKSGDNLAKIAAAHEVTAALLCRINGLSDARKLRAQSTIKIVQGPFHCVVSKSKFNMDLYLGGLPGDHAAMYVRSFPVGLGKDDSTPSGTWMVEPQRKLANPTYYSPRGDGVIPAGDPKNPLGHFWIGLIGTEGGAVGKTSYGIHGTIDPTSIGKQASLGCIRMRNEDVAIVFEMLVEGKSNVVVRD